MLAQESGMEPVNELFFMWLENKHKYRAIHSIRMTYMLCNMGVWPKAIKPPLKLLTSTLMNLKLGMLAKEPGNEPESWLWLKSL